MNIQRVSIHLRVLAVVATATLLWLAFALFVVPVVIKDAYRQESLAFLNDLIRDRANYPSEHYLDKWGRVAWITAAAIPPAVYLSFGMGWFLWSTAAALWRDSVRMSRARVIVAHAVVVVVVGGMVFDIVNGREDWPFSCYPMYSGLEQASELTEMRLYGVTQSGQELYLSGHRDPAFEPFDASRLNVALWQLHAGGRDGHPRLRAAVRSLLTRFNRDRSTADGLVALRMYRCTWRLQPGAVNAASPDTRELILEMPAGGEG